MYVPDRFREARRNVLLNAIQEIRLAALVVGGRPELAAAHVPMIMREEAGDLFLEGHVALGNSLWRAVEEGAPALAIFQGPHAYVRPGWLPTKREHGKVVPTWTYVAVHASGQVTVQRDPDWLRRHVDRLTEASENDRPDPWMPSDAPADFLRKLLGAIVGLSLKVDRLDGIWKMLQHHPAANRLGVMDGLRHSGRASELAVAEVMKTLECGRDRE